MPGCFLDGYADAASIPQGVSRHDGFFEKACTNAFAVTALIGAPGRKRADGNRPKHRRSSFLREDAGELYDWVRHGSLSVVSVIVYL